MINVSFLQAFGIELPNRPDISWHYFCSCLSLIPPDTPLGQIVSIRAETDTEIIKNMTPSQKKIRRDWYSKRFAEMSEEEKIEKNRAFSRQLQMMFGGN